MTSTASQPIINTDLVLLDVDAGGDKQTVIGRLVSRLADAGRTHDTDGLIAAAMAREEQSATGLPGGIAIPHCRSPYVDTASIGFARLSPAVDFGAPDGPADLAFLIAAPEAGGAEHMKLLSSLARALVRKDFVESLRNATTPAEVVELVDGVVNATAEKPKPAAEPAKATPKTLVAVTACPTGIAHTYMAADSLVAAAKKAGATLHVETQGSSGSTPLAASTIAEADAVIFATDVGVKDKQRFAGKPVVASGVKRAINEPDKMVAEALAAAGDPAAARVQGDARAPGRRGAVPAGGVGWGTRTRQILLTGVSYMIPFVAAGGLLIALGFLFAGYDIANKPEGSDAVAGQYHRAQQLADQPARRRFHAVPGRGVVQHRRVGVRVPGSRTGRLHLLRDRRPSRHRAGIHRGRGRRLRRRRLHRRHRRRSDRRVHGAVDQPHRRPALAPRLDARGDHPAGRVAGRRPVDVPAARPPAGRDHLRSDQLAQRHVGHLGHHARRSSSA